MGIGQRTTWQRRRRPGAHGRGLRAEGQARHRCCIRGCSGRASLTAEGQRQSLALSAAVGTSAGAASRVSSFASISSTWLS